MYKLSNQKLSLYDKKLQSGSCRCFHMVLKSTVLIFKLLVVITLTFVFQGKIDSTF